METVLAKIVADKRIWVEARKTQQPLESFKNELTPSDRDFYQALNTGKTEFILECKKASPSKGLIRDDFDLDYIASVYAKHASAISVLTDEKYFQGDFNFLPQVRNQVTQPVICKDFMIDEYQVYLARHYQADAILLMLSVLDDDEYRHLAEVATSLSLGYLTEVSNEEELERAIALKAPIVGINNRNLRDLSITLERTKELAPRLPKGTIVISESGIHNHQQVKELSKFANGFLIGSSLMSEDNLEIAVRRVLLGENKVCGLTHPDDANLVYQAGSVYGGLIFAKGSKRRVDIETARLIMSGAPLHYVGVFQNQSMDEVAQTANQLGLAAVQLHGAESQADVTKLRTLLPKSVKIWKAYGVSDTLPTLLEKHVDKHLLDAQVGSQSGGTGMSFDWALLEEYSNNGTGDTSTSHRKNIMIAGGLSADNVEEAGQLGCIGLDLNSGVEIEPGKKDPQKLLAAFTALRNY
ncbi:bifunctional indole-3-glycerol-phosphate synthase TrpC/phosphoribosylanthranilate isomerase TrpF [Vibrio rumoiensis]|uniref:Multifunctional fusion protein n=1 Tax=Vibrio rumoiensis 1S-45 TaxID=1188252 RepID=A0A1E5E436_9VIBR|nr:bifunctional indole-3-glycerol-phosphate synthase TrpC/phosphoribosylanthranilate isomerase TrpF [Vibrio rumoiensis]OEF27441.1 bifunctional indole-3-glycerol phosphate synthase/phosphoribosylanthranilate isomerase [Vibrio rumoiensis 1S-45]